MDGNKNKIPKDKDGGDDLSDHRQKNGSPAAVNEEPSDQATQVENRDLGNERMLSTIELLERLEVTIRGRFLVTTLRDQKVGSSTVKGSEDILDVLSEAIRNVAFGKKESGSQGAVTQKGGSSDQDSVIPPPVNPMPRSGDRDSMEIASNANMNVVSGNQESGSPGAVTQKGIVFGPVTQKGSCSDQDNMEKKPNAKRNVRSSDDLHKGEAGHGEESEDDMEVDRDTKRAKK